MAARLEVYIQEVAPMSAVSVSVIVCATADPDAATQDHDAQMSCWGCGRSTVLPAKEVARAGFIWILHVLFFAFGAISCKSLYN